MIHFKNVFKQTVITLLVGGNTTLPTLLLFSFKTNHRLLHPFVLALLFNKNPADKNKKSMTS